MLHTVFQGLLGYFSSFKDFCHILDGVPVKILRVLCCKEMMGLTRNLVNYELQLTRVQSKRLENKNAAWLKRQVENV